MSNSVPSFAALRPQSPLLHDPHKRTRSLSQGGTEPVLPLKSDFSSDLVYPEKAVYYSCRGFPTSSKTVHWTVFEFTPCRGIAVRGFRHTPRALPSGDYGWRPGTLGLACRLGRCCCFAAVSTGPPAAPCTSRSLCKGLRNFYNCLLIQLL